jgi:hypothetical protein
MSLSADRAGTIIGARADDAVVAGRNRDAKRIAWGLADTKR